MARYLVTGATGFLGGRLTSELLDAGHAVVALCREDEPELADRGVIVARGDVLDGSTVERAAQGADGAFHCAGKVSRRPEDAEELYRLHVDGTKSTLAACKRAGVKRVVVASTSGTVAVSQDPTHVASEADPAPVGLLSRWPYYRSKLYAEEAALAMNEPGALEVVCVNPTLLLGPGDERRSSTEDVRLFLEGRVPAVPAGGLSFVDVRDAASAMVLAMEKGVPGKRYLLGACNMTLREFFRRLERISGVRAPWAPVPSMPSLARPAARLLLEIAGKKRWGGSELDPVSFEMAQFYWYLDASLAMNELGWRPRDPMRTLEDTVEDLRGGRFGPHGARQRDPQFGDSDAPRLD
jgi:dihydroflavonol-4-reductase